MVQIMNKIEIDELKIIQLNVLKYTADYCDSHDIKYWLDNGTLLGAVRHKGYIPWDDDIDIGMLREDYNKLISTFNNNNERYFVASLETKPDFYLPHAKICDTHTILFEPDEKGYKLNVNIDVFVYDNAPNNIRQLKIQFDKRDFYRKLYYYQHINYEPQGNILKKTALKIIVLFLKLFPDGYFIKKMIKNCQRFNKIKTDEVGNFSSFSRQHCNKRVFNSFINVEFEGLYFKAPIGYDDWLRSFYGDYMKLPPEEKRVSHHSFVAYSLNDEDK